MAVLQPGQRLVGGDRLPAVAGQAMPLQPVLVVDHPERVPDVAPGPARDRDVAHRPLRRQGPDRGHEVGLLVAAQLEGVVRGDERGEPPQGRGVDPPPGPGIGPAEALLALRPDLLLAG
ncbi:MAG: hypothetical protein MUE47_02995 [Acidobacteria bacterium]|nr:hypothetical protein [Acidobacteriota bacterium]